MKSFFSITLAFLIFFSLSLPTPIQAQQEGTSSENRSGEQNSDWTETLGTITKITFKGSYRVSEETLRDALSLQVGQPFSKARLENSLDDLRRWGVFANTEVLVVYDDQKIELHYELSQGYLIKDVKISGNYPLLKSQVKRALFLNPGSIYQKDRLEEQIDRLDKFYEKEGYFGTTVLAIEDYDEDNLQVTLYFKIKKGTTYRIRNTTVEGGEAVHPGRIKSIIFTFTHFKPKSLKKDLQKITRIFKKKGFVRARVRVGEESFDYDARKVDLNILIRQGPRVQIEFEGNENYFARTLKKEITLIEDGDFDEFELEASKKRLIQFYQERGYQEVQIEWTRKRINKELYLVTFNIQEGPKSEVRAINFTGNENIPAKKLRERMATKVDRFFISGDFYQPLFEQDLQTLIDYYHDQGFLDAKILSWEKIYGPIGDTVRLDIDIQEGPRAMVESLELEGVNPEFIEEIKAKLQLRPGDYYSQSRLDYDVETTLLYMANHGYPYAKVETKIPPPKDHHYSILFQVNPGQLVKIKQILFVGNIKTKEVELRKNLRFKEGEPFSAENILQSQINLRRLGIFETVNIENLGISNLQKEVTAVIRVQEKKDKIIDFEVGYSTDYGFSGQVIFNKLNVFGRAKNMNAKVQVGTQVNRGEFNFIFPRLRGSSLQLTLGAYGGREARPFYRNNSVGTYGSLFKQFSQNMYTWGRLDFSFNDVNTSNTVFDKINPNPIPNDQTRLTTTLGVAYDTRDNFGDPRSGAYLSGTAALTDQFFTLNGNYSTTRANLGYWYSPFRRVTIANVLRVAQIFKLPSDTIVPADQRLYLGGDNTVRGFRQDALLPSGGTFSLVHNLELQIRVFNKIQVVGFLDSGVVTNGISEVNTTTFRHSAGPGIRYVTPVGPIRLDWGFILDPEPTDSSTNRVHFSFGYFF